MQLQLINLGRQKVNKVVPINSIDDIYGVVSQYLLSSDIEIEEAIEPDTFDIYVGLYRPVGQVKVIKE